MGVKGTMMLEGHLEAHLPPVGLRKDVALTLAAAEVDDELPTLRGVLAALDRAVATGLGDLVMAAVARGVRCRWSRPRWRVPASGVAVRDPAGATPVRRADLDHITEWPDGATDVTNLHPVGRRWHNHKTSKAWTVIREADGATTWRHRRHGWVLRLAPPRRARAQPPRDGPRRASTGQLGKPPGPRHVADPAVQLRLAGWP